jgi:glycosyltransferase involved in cell wall biosynthesis
MSQRIRVLELRSVRGTGGGPEKTILLGAAQANRQAFDVIVCYIRDRRDDVFQLDKRAARLDITYVEVHERHSFDVRIWPKLRRIVRERQIDIVHAHDYKTNLVALLLARRAGIIPLSTAHGWAGHSRRERFVYYPADKRLLARFPRVVAVSNTIREILVQHGARPERIVLLLNAIDPDDFRRVPGRRDAVRQALGYGPDHFVVGAVGRLHPVKRFDLLMQAVAALLPAHPGVRLAIVGDGSLRGELEALAGRLNIAHACRLLGHRDDLTDLYQAFDVSVQSSESEGAPNAVLEAMAMETPLVATDVGGTRELATPGAHALIVARHDVPALAAAIESVLQDPESARARAQAARVHVKSDLSFAARTRRLEGLYEEMVRDRDTPGNLRGVPHDA